MCFPEAQGFLQLPRWHILLSITRPASSPSFFNRWAPLFVRLGGVEATLRARSTVEIRADQRRRPGTTDVPRCVRAFGLLWPTEGIDNGTAHPALQWESAQGLRSPSLPLEGGQAQPLGAGGGGRRGDRQLTQGSRNVCLRGPPGGRSVSAGSVFLKQQQLGAVSGCIYFTDSLVFFPGVEARALPLLE